MGGGGRLNTCKIRVSPPQIKRQQLQSLDLSFELKPRTGSPWISGFEKWGYFAEPEWDSY